MYDQMRSPRAQPVGALRTSVTNILPSNVLNCSSVPLRKGVEMIQFPRPRIKLSTILVLFILIAQTVSIVLLQRRLSLLEDNLGAPPLKTSWGPFDTSPVTNTTSNSTLTPFDSVGNEPRVPTLPPDDVNPFELRTEPTPPSDNTAVAIDTGLRQATTVSEARPREDNDSSKAAPTVPSRSLPSASSGALSPYDELKRLDWEIEAKKQRRAELLEKLRSADK